MGTSWPVRQYNAVSAIDSGSCSLVVPYPDWMDGERVRQALSGSDARTFLGRW